MGILETDFVFLGRLEITYDHMPQHNLTEPPESIEINGLWVNGHMLSVPDKEKLFEIKFWMDYPYDKLDPGWYTFESIAEQIVWDELLEQKADKT